jgi:hypothetical protein
VDRRCCRRVHHLQQRRETPPYIAKLADPNIRELLIDVPEDAVRALFGTPRVKATIV